MKKRFEKLIADLREVDDFGAQLQSLSQAASAIPALNQLQFALFNRELQRAADLVCSVYDDLEAFYENRGPEAMFLRRLARHGQIDKSLAEDQIKISTLPRFAPEQSLVHQRLLEGMISRTSSTGYSDGEGGLILDLGDRLEEIDHCMSADYWATAPVPTIACSSQMDPLYFGDWKGTMTARLIHGGYNSADKTLPLELVIKYNNGCELHARMSLHYRMVERDGSDYNAQLSLYWTGPMGWQTPEPRWIGTAYETRRRLGQLGDGQIKKMVENTGGASFVGEVHNAFEDVDYPVLSDFINHRLVRELFKKLLQGMNVNVDAMHTDNPYGDPKFVYQKVKEILSYYPMKLEENVSDDCTTRGFGLSKFIDRAYTEEYCRDLKLVARSETEGTDEWTRIHPKGDLPSYGTVIEYAARWVNGKYNCYDAVIVVDDKAETATLHIAYSKTELKVKMTPRTVHLFLKSLEKTRRWLLQNQGFAYDSGTSITGG